MRKKKIRSLSGLKVAAIALLFWWHSSLPDPDADLGARSCEFFFVVSGFLVGYNYCDRDVPATWRESFRYYFSKIRGMWPLHFVCWLICLLMLPAAEILTRNTVILSAWNLTLLQAWSPDQNVFWSFNGTSWFLSSLLFCYFLSPLLLKSIRTRRRSGIFFVIIAILRYLIERLQLDCPGQYTNLNVHISPLIRAMEFWLGMLAVPWFQAWMRAAAGRRSAREQSSGGKKPSGRVGRVLFTVVEAAALFGTAYLMKTMNNRWIRADYVLLFVVLTVVFAFEGGYLSDFFGLGIFQQLSALQFEFFLLHQPVIKLVWNHFPDSYVQYIWRWNIPMFAGIWLLSALWHRYVRGPASNLMGKIIRKAGFA